MVVVVDPDTSTVDETWVVERVVAGSVVDKISVVERMAVVVTSSEAADVSVLLSD